MARQSLMEAGSAPTLPGFGVARCQSQAPVHYQPSGTPAIELAARKVALCFGVSHGIARTIAELAGMGGRT